MLARVRPSLGMYPALSDEQLPEGAAVLAQNCRLGGANLQPWRALGAALASVPAGTKTIFKFGSLWLAWPEDTDVARSPLASDAFDRLYFTRAGLGAYFTYAAIATAGATTAHKLGIPAPTVAPVLGWSYSGGFSFGLLDETTTETGDTDNQLANWQVAGLKSAHLAGDLVHWGLQEVYAIGGTAQFSGLSLSGATAANTAAGVLYFAIADAAGTRTVSLYKSTNPADKVAEGSRAGDGAITLAAVGGSGLTGSVTIAYTADDALDAANTIEVRRTVTLYGDSAGTSPLASGYRFSDGSVTLSAAVAGGPTGSVTLTWVGDDTDIANNGLSFDWEERAYFYNWVDVVGAEGPNSPVAEISIPVGASVLLTLPTEPPTVSGHTYSNIDTLYVYRANTGSALTDYQFVAEVAVTAGTCTDAVADEDLGEAFPAAEWDPPPADLHGLAAHPAGFLVGYSAALKAVCFSEPYFPHAWPLAYRIPLSDVPVGLGTFGMSAAVLTQGPPVLVTGQLPGALSMERYEAGWPCVAKRSIVDLGEAILYAAAEGLVLFGAGRAELVTGGRSGASPVVFSADEWADYQPATVEGYGWDGNYLGFYGGGAGGFFFSKTGQFSLLTDAATAGWRDPATGALYLAVGTAVRQWQGAASAMKASFRSAVFVMPRPLNMGCAQVLARGYPLTFRLYADGELKFATTVADRRVFRLPGGYLADRYQLEVESAHAVDEILLAGTMAEMRQT